MLLVNLFFYLLHLFEIQTRSLMMMCVGRRVAVDSPGVMMSVVSFTRRNRPPPLPPILIHRGILKMVAYGGRRTSVLDAVQRHLPLLLLIRGRRRRRHDRKGRSGRQRRKMRWSGWFALLLVIQQEHLCRGRRTPARFVYVDAGRRRRRKLGQKLLLLRS